MALLRFAVAASTLLLSAAALAQDGAPANATPPAQGGASDWLGPVTCKVNPRGSEVRCVSETGAAVSTCTSRGYLFVKDIGSDEDFNLVPHSCDEQGAKQTCIVKNKMSWTCGLRDGEAYAISVRARSCYYFDNQKLFDCRIYDQVTGAKAHLIRCNIGRLGAGRTLKCRPIERTKATWL